MRGYFDGDPSGRVMAVDGKLESKVIAMSDTAMKRSFDNVHGTGESVLASLMVTMNVLITG